MASGKPGVKMVASSQWPACLWLVRHGESTGNVARDKAHAAGVSRIDIQSRDVDVELSERGRDQARAIGAWFAELDSNERPDSLLSSPYARAQGTAMAIQACAGGKQALPMVTDERFRDSQRAHRTCPLPALQRRSSVFPPKSHTPASHPLSCD